MSSLQISTDKSLLDEQMIYDFLRVTYWAKDRDIDVVQRSIENFLCFGAYLGGKQIGFARVITDKAVFGYVADVFVLDEFRGKGYAKNLLQEIIAHPEIKDLRLVMLATQDAHGLYQQFGFELIPGSDRVMTLFAINDEE